MLHNVKVVTNMAKRLVFLFKQVTVRYPCATNSESVHDRFLFTVDCFGSVEQTIFKVWEYFIEFVSGFIVPGFPPICVDPAYVISLFIRE